MWCQEPFSEKRCISSSIQGLFLSIGFDRWQQVRKAKWSRALLLFYEEVHLDDAELVTLVYFVFRAYYQACLIQESSMLQTWEDEKNMPSLFFLPGLYTGR